MVKIYFTWSSELVQFDEKFSLITDQHWESALVESGSKENPYSSHSWSRASYLKHKSLTSLLAISDVISKKSNSWRTNIDPICEWYVLKVSEASKDGSSGCEVETSGEVDVVLPPVGGQSVLWYSTFADHVYAGHTHSRKGQLKVSFRKMIRGIRLLLHTRNKILKMLTRVTCSVV